MGGKSTVPGLKAVAFCVILDDAELYRSVDRNKASLLSPCKAVQTQDSASSSLVSVHKTAVHNHCAMKAEKGTSYENGADQYYTRQVTAYRPGHCLPVTACQVTACHVTAQQSPEAAAGPSDMVANSDRCHCLWRCHLPLPVSMKVPEKEAPSWRAVLGR